MNRLFANTVSVREAHAIPVRLGWSLFVFCVLSCSLFLFAIWFITNQQGDFTFVKNARWVLAILLTGAFMIIFQKESVVVGEKITLFQKLFLSYTFILMSLSSSFFIASHYVGIYSHFILYFAMVFWIGVIFLGYVKFLVFTKGLRESQMLKRCIHFMEVIFYLNVFGFLVQIAFLIRIKELHVSVISIFCFIIYLLSINSYNLMFYKVPMVLRKKGSSRDIL